MNLTSLDRTLSQQLPHLAAGIILVSLWTLEGLLPLHLGRSRRLTHGFANFGLALIMKAGYYFLSKVNFNIAWIHPIKNRFFYQRNFRACFKT